MTTRADPYRRVNIPPTFDRRVIASPVRHHQLELGNFRREILPMPEPRGGEVLVRINPINIHSSTRLRIEQGQTLLGETDLQNFACVQVVASKDPAFTVVDTLACQSGWQQYQVISSRSLPSGFKEPGHHVKALYGTCSPWNYVFRPHLVKRWSADVLMDVFGTSGLLA